MIILRSVFLYFLIVIINGKLMRKDLKENDIKLTLLSILIEFLNYFSILNCRATKNLKWNFTGNEKEKK